MYSFILFWVTARRKGYYSIYIKEALRCLSKCKDKKIFFKSGFGYFSLWKMNTHISPTLHFFVLMGSFIFFYIPSFFSYWLFNFYGQNLEEYKSNLLVDFPESICTMFISIWFVLLCKILSGLSQIHLMAVNTWKQWIQVKSWPASSLKCLCAIPYGPVASWITTDNR